MLALHIPCHACTSRQGRPGRTPSVLSSCVLAAAPLRLRGGGASASDGPSCLSCSVSSGLSPAPLASIADYNNHICICFVLFFSLFCFSRLFFFLSLWIYLWLAETSQQPISQTTWLKVTPHCNHCFSRGHNWDIIPASRHKLQIGYFLQQHINLFLQCQGQPKADNRTEDPPLLL